MGARTEREVQDTIRATAPLHGDILWRNNVGAAGPVRFGLANDSAVMNKRIKSSDLIGIRRRLITPSDVGLILGVFMAVEVKRPDWTYSETYRELAQQRYLQIVREHGGVAVFATCPGDIWPV